MSKRKSKICELIEECWNQKNREDTLYDLFSPNIIHELILGKRLGKNSFRQMADDWCQSFPDMHASITHLEEFNNSVIIRADVEATYLKPFQDEHSEKDDVVSKSVVLEQLTSTPPTGKKVTYEIEEIYIFDQDQVVRFYSYTDASHLFNQINLMIDEEEYEQQTILKKNQDALTHRLNEIHQNQLSQREIECLSLCLLGMSAKQIGALLGLSYRTVETYLYQSFQIFGVRGHKECLEQMITYQLLLMWHDLGRLLLKQYLGEINVKK